MTVIWDNDGSMDYVRNGTLHRAQGNDVVMVENAAQVEELPAYPVGTIAHTAGWQDAWEVGTDGTWVQMTAGDEDEAEPAGDEDENEPAEEET